MQKAKLEKICEDTIIYVSDCVDKAYQAAMSYTGTWEDYERAKKVLNEALAWERKVRGI